MTQWKNFFRTGLPVAFAMLVLGLAPALMGSDRVRDIGATPQSTDKREGEKRAERRIVIVVHRDNPIRTLREKEVKRIFLRQRQKWSDGRMIKVFERHSKMPIRGDFLKSVLKMKPYEIRAYWNNLKLTRGVKPPKILRTSRMVKHYLKRSKGGICYLYEDKVDKDDKSIRIVKRVEGGKP